MSVSGDLKAKFSLDGKNTFSTRNTFFSAAFCLGTQLIALYTSATPKSGFNILLKTVFLPQLVSNSS